MVSRDSWAPVSCFLFLSGSLFLVLTRCLALPRPRNKWRTVDAATVRAYAAQRAEAALQSASEEADARVAEATKAREEHERAALATKALAETYAARLQGEVLDATARLREKEEELKALTSRDDWARQLMQQRSALSLLRQQLLEARRERAEERRMFAQAAGVGVSGTTRTGAKGSEGAVGSGGGSGGKSNKARADKNSKSSKSSKGTSKRSKVGKMSGAGGAYPRISAAKLQRFLEERGREAALNRAKIDEYERREQATARPWHELERREEVARTALRRVKRETAATVAMWEAMVTERDRAILALNDQLAALASTEAGSDRDGRASGGGDGARRAAAEVLVRQVFELQRKNEELGARLAAAAAAQAAAASPHRQRHAYGFGGEWGRGLFVFGYHSLPLLCACLSVSLCLFPPHILFLPLFLSRKLVQLEPPMQAQTWPRRRRRQGVALVPHWRFRLVGCKTLKTS